MTPIREIRAALLAVAPTLASILAAVAGVMLLTSGATPSEPERFVFLLRVAPQWLIEASHTLSSMIGLLLLMLAFGLRARIDAAWWAAVALLWASTILAVLKGLNWEEALLLGFSAVVFSPLHPAFPRKSRLMQMELTPGWMFSAVAVLLGAWLIGRWAFFHADYRSQPWWRALADEDYMRTVRSSAGAAVLLLAIGVWRLFATTATPKVIGDADEDFAKVRSILASAENAEPESNLALLGDKRFLFSPSGQSFLMFGVRGRSWIAMGGPVGQRDERMDLLWRFRELADAHGARTALYGLDPEDLPDVVELGFSIQKTGESAVVQLEGFSLQGRRREVLRRNWRKAGEGGALFEVIEAGAAGAVMEDLQAVSDAWLGRHAGGEKSFSMGRFDPRYVCEFPTALVRVEGKIVAFATLWTTPDKSTFSMDLMRYSDGAPPNIMDFLFVELLQWGRDQGYAGFEFGVAPLAGLEDRRLAPILSRVGHLLFERGEDIYNFRGVRRYKDKYDPLWRPRYVAAPHKWVIPLLMADVGLLSSGGVAGLTKRPKEPKKAA
ncbi:bifunctional lysylphosphatidylglycerol flippase/synthetase MprF [Caulobacter sp. 73W]|uniref:Bifunctional lysylphosphatidylglycerol flippase/synthetase MprF n=1 Tax=Caulobacter sp. 73W TaxID=3161137 RepID=A0AB39KV79_9CAUL